MAFPLIDRKERHREYDSYSSLTRSKIVYSYLFEGLSHRDLDKTVLGLNPDESKGWQSMGILHFLGLRNPHKGIFKNSSLNDSLKTLAEIQSEDTSLIIKHLDNSSFSEIIDKQYFESEFQKEVHLSLKDSNSREARLKVYANKAPQQVEVISIAFKRNPDVVAFVLARAKGLCEDCMQRAPFLRAKDNTPYLEVHHKIRLADGGEDTVENAIALCPNCHRKAHFGQV